MRLITLLLVLNCGLVAAEVADGAHDVLEKAYAALDGREYEAAIDLFRQAIEISEPRADIRKDLGYTLLKIGENVAARDEFAVAVELAQGDYHTALEYAFLCYETDRKAEARRVFDRVRQSGDAESRKTAKRAFENIDGPLREGITRWTEAVAVDPGNFSAHRELAELAEQRDDLALAAEHYERAWRLRSERMELLVELGRVLTRSGDSERGMSALLAASRGTEPRVAEQARALLPERYPYVYEFESALELTPDNVELRRELAYLHLAMDDKAAAEEQFRRVLESEPDDLLTASQLGFLLLAREDYNGAMPLLRRVLSSGDEAPVQRVREALEMSPAPPDPPSPVVADSPRAAASPSGNQGQADPKALAEASLEKNYLQDAMKYLALAHDRDPVDFAVMLDLGRTNNVLQRDEEAVRWFDLARRSPDPWIAGQAEESYRNLSPQFARFRTTLWTMPLYSSRWKDMFGYAQVKTEVRLGNLPVWPYVSVRFAGDARRTIGTIVPQYLSESSFILGIGLRTAVWNGAHVWAEAGADVSYLDRRDRGGRMAPDYRAGVAYARGWGSGLGGETHGLFFETQDDGIIMSRFSNTFLVSTRNRAGYTAATMDALGELQLQAYWNGNLNADARRQAWANFADTGPGVRFRWRSMPPSMSFSVELLRGHYLLGNGAPTRGYQDVRVGAWYAFSR